MKSGITGRINSFQSFAALDGPGVRFAVFMQGCPLRCACCHNPETWETGGGTEYSADEIFAKVLRYREYFGENGGVTVSGGEPLMQPQFVTALFKKCRESGINTCLDTSGCIINGEISELLRFTDYCLLDIKYTDDERYRKYVGCGINAPLEFLALLQKNGIKTTVRQVIIKGVNDDVTDIEELKKIVCKYSCAEKTELLPFKKLCMEKYRAAGIEFKFENIEETTENDIKHLYSLFA